MQFLGLLNKDSVLVFCLLSLLKKFRFLSFLGVFRVRLGYSKIHLPDIVDSCNKYIKRSYGDKLIIQIPYPGIGDHLFYSTLPEFLIKNNLYEQVLISDLSVYRFDGIKDLVWGCNPYISGFCDSKGWSYSGIRPENGNFIDGIEILFGGDESIRGRSPKVFHGNNLFRMSQSFVGKAYVDLSSFSNRDTPSFEAIIAYLCKHEKCPIAVTEPRNYTGTLFKNFEKIILPNSIFEYCSLISSCERYYCLYSGGNSLAPALGIGANVFVKKVDLAQTYEKNNYIVL